MGVGLKNNTKLAIEPEVTEGTFVQASGVNSYLQPLDGLSATPNQEDLERAILTGNIGKAKSIAGIKSATGTIPAELRASGVEGADVDAANLLESAFGAKRDNASQFTTGTGHTTSVLDGTAISSSFDVGDIFVILESGDHSVHAVKAVTASTLTYTPARTVAQGAPSDAVLLSKVQMYFTANSGHPSLSISIFDGDVTNQQIAGSKVNSFAIENFNPGQLGTMTFGFESLKYTEVDVSAPQTPAFDTGSPPVICASKIFFDDDEKDVNSFSVTMTNTLAFQTTTGADNCRLSSLVSERVVGGSVVIYKADDSIQEFTDFDDNTSFGLFGFTAAPSGVAGELTLGSIVGFWLPSCKRTEKNVEDVDGLLTENISFEANRGATGTENEEMYLGFI